MSVASAQGDDRLLLARVALPHGLTLLPARAAWIERERTLLLADLHLGKAEALASIGAPVPEAAGLEQLARLAGLVRGLSAQRVVVLGDLLHARAGLTDRMIEHVAEWRRAHLAGVQWDVVPGNHDRGLSRVADAWALGVLPACVREGGGLVLVHDAAHAPDVRDDELVVCGHEHPAVGVGPGPDGTRRRVPAFVLDRRGAAGVLTLPAFSTFTAGGSVGPAPGRTVYAIVEQGNAGLVALGRA